MAMRGNSLLMKPLPLSVAEQSYSATLKALEVDESLSNQEKANLLFNIPPENFVAKVGPQIPLIPVLDGEIISANITYARWESPDLEEYLPGRS